MEATIYLDLDFLSRRGDLGFHIADDFAFILKVRLELPSVIRDGCSCKHGHRVKRKQNGAGRRRSSVVVSITECESLIASTRRRLILNKRFGIALA